MKKLIFFTVSAILLLSVNSALNAQLTANAGNDTTICSGSMITLQGSASGGTVPYTFTWSPATGLSATNIANPAATPSSTTTYTLFVSDGASNSASATVTITVNQTPVINVQDQMICFGSCATLVVTGGVNYSWSDGEITQGITVCPTSTTVYSVTVTGASGCTASEDFVITVDPPLGVSLSSTNSYCGMYNGTVTANAYGGTPPYMYQWSNGQNTQTAVNLPSGNYSLTVVDAAGCTATNSVTIIDVPGMTVDIVGLPASCGLCNGSTTGNISGGSAPYTFTWSNGSTVPIANNLCPGVYSLTVTDVNACTAWDTVVINNVTSIAVIMDTLIYANCADNLSGSISVHGDCGAGGYNYKWAMGSTPLAETSGTISDIQSGYYFVTVYDSNSDSASASFYVGVTPNIYASISTVNINCGMGGSATVNVQGAHPPFSFLWNDPLQQTTATATDLIVGYYMVTITDSIGCTLIAGANIISVGCENIIKGRVYLDLNQNCVQDSGEAGIPNKPLYAMPGYDYGSTDLNGDFIITTTEMNNVLYAPYYMNSPYTLTCPLSGTYAVNFTSTGDTSLANDFGYYADPNYFDLVLHPGWSSASPGFNKEYWICYYNNSNVPKDVTIRYTYDSLLQFTSCTQGGVHYPLQHKIEWTINNLQPSTIWDWNTKPEIYFYVPPTVGINTILHSCFEILPIIGDANPSDNTQCFDEIVTGSHDPNSKSVSPVGLEEAGFISANDSTLLYTIHFQNDGNDTAFTVVVVDTLSPYVNPVSVIPGAASHPYTFSLSGQGILTFRFDNILLPDSNVNEPASNGYVNFTVKQKPGNTEGTVIQNTAWNYFDFNPPVNTNTVKNTIGTPQGIAEEIYDNGVSIFPNPFGEEFNIEIKNTEMFPCILTVYNSLGKCVKMNELKQPLTSIKCRDLSRGIYFYKLDDRNQKLIGSGKLIMK
jgi:uncharacterized repeat protein (TIGR01451 family)